MISNGKGLFVLQILCIKKKWDQILHTFYHGFLCVYRVLSANYFPFTVRESEDWLWGCSSNPEGIERARHILRKVDSSTLFLLHCRSFQQMWAILLLPRDALLGKLSETKSLVRLFVFGKFCWLVCARVYLVSVLIITPVYYTINHSVAHTLSWMVKTVNDSVPVYTFVQVLSNLKLWHFHLCEFIWLFSCSETGKASH